MNTNLLFVFVFLCVDLWLIFLREKCGEGVNGRGFLHPFFRVRSFLSRTLAADLAARGTGRQGIGCVCGAPWRKRERIRMTYEIDDAVGSCGYGTWACGGCDLCGGTGTRGGE